MAVGERQNNTPANAAEVQVLDLWLSPYSMRVKLALAAKGVPFSTIPQDIGPKSPLLLQSNPVHKKVPVLLHHGKPVCESLIICEYIDEAFPTSAHLLPKDPYLKAMARFWADFADQKVLDSLLKILRVPKEEFGSVIEDIKSHLRTIEEGAFLSEPEYPFFGGLEAGFLDIVMGPLVVALPIMQGLLTSEDVFEVEKLPRLHAWLKAFSDLPFVNTILPQPDKVLQEALRELRKIRFPHE